jgi:hypothetical protein
MRQIMWIQHALFLRREQDHVDLTLGRGELALMGNVRAPPCTTRKTLVACSRCCAWIYVVQNILLTILQSRLFVHNKARQRVRVNEVERWQHSAPPSPLILAQDGRALPCASDIYLSQ